MDKNNELEKDFSTLLFDAEENGNTAETLDSPANGETFQFTNIENSENASAEMFPTGELESAEAVFASAAGIEATAEVSETVSEIQEEISPDSDISEEKTVESAATVFHASGKKDKRTRKPAANSGWLAKLSGKDGGVDWRKPIAAGILLLMCTGAVFYYGGVVRASTADPTLNATSFLTDLTAYHKMEVADARTDVPVLTSERNVTMVGTSVEEDMSIRVEDENGDRITGIAFEFAVTSPDDETQYYTEDDMDGSMYIDGIS
ncbi:MAG: hypothetical protein IKE18_09275, partial [Oscillospiraceae bacterium]|nr:hypothetical protein [Oscillospiraceae bacterium]